MTDTKRTIFAGLLIGFLTLCIPFYLRLIGVMPTPGSEAVKGASFTPEAVVSPAPLEPPFSEKKNISAPALLSPNSVVSHLGFFLITEKYHASLSSSSGGSFLDFSISGAQDDGYKYMGGYDSSGSYNKDLNVSLMFPESGPCNPCLELDSTKITSPFRLVSPQILNGETINLYNNDSLVVKMELPFNGTVITKTTTFYADSYLVLHEYDVKNHSAPLFVTWEDGIKTTEKNLYEELTYSTAYIGQQKEIGDITLSPSELTDVIAPEFFPGKTDWVAARNKYFINSLVSESSVGGRLSARSLFLNNANLVPAYSLSLEFRNFPVAVTQFFGPLDVDIIESSGTYLDRVMNFGWLPIQPFSRSVLWILKKLHLFGLNYGIILIVFAFLIRVVTGPLTKKSYQSTLKMQTIQPQMKKIQEKYKNDSQRLNKEMMNLYKTSGVNPLGGCFPMLIQMPLLFSLFIVFRSTIEFRGAPFFGWINNLSQPDTVFYLPFNIPIYGDQVAFLPIVLGISMFMTQRLSMATMDKSQKPMMYMMSAFFFLLFNSFPSGLNLYYTVYNFLNYLQQKSLKK